MPGRAVVAGSPPHEAAALVVRRLPPPVPSLDGRLCLITGAASGIGRATALAPAARGARAVPHRRRRDGAARDVADEIRAAGGRVGHAAPADVADHDAVVAFADEVHAAHGAMDVVMNIAGIATWGPIERLEHEHWRRRSTST